jgi:hypothetical protein
MRELSEPRSRGPGRHIGTMSIWELPEEVACGDVCCHCGSSLFERDSKPSVQFPGAARRCYPACPPNHDSRGRSADSDDDDE